MAVLALIASTAAVSLPVSAQAKSPARASVTDIDPAALADAQAIIAVMIAPEKHAEYFGGIANAITSQMRGNATRQLVDPGLRKVIDEFLDTIPERMMPVTIKHVPMLLDAMARAYVREFSAEELRDIRAFAESPAGGHYLSRSAAVLADPEVAAANRAYSQEAMELAASLRPELLEKVNGYIAAHPDAAPRRTPPADPAQGR